MSNHCAHQLAREISRRTLTGIQTQNEVIAAKQMYADERVRSRTQADASYLFIIIKNIHARQQSVYIA
jgi:hypothetical protein